MSSAIQPLTRALLVLALGVAGLGWALPGQAQQIPNPEWIRVAVTKEDAEVTLQIHGRFSVKALQTGHEVHAGRRLEPTPVRAVAEGLALGAQVLPVQGLRIQPTSEASITLNGKRLRGQLEITRNKNATLLVVNYVQLEDYLRGVLSKEAPDYWPPEALKAIAIAARTYALYQRFTRAAGTFDVTGDVMSQEYGGKSAEKHATTQAVRATAGQILLSGQRELFPTYYHSTCGGVTENGRVMGKTYDIAPLRGRIACTFCEASPFYRWVRRVTKADVNWALKKSRFGTIGAVRGMRVTRRTEAGRASAITLTGAKRTLTLSGYDFRALFGFDHIRSPQFTVVEDGDAFVLDGRGWGHGVGMCQWGAAELARRGLSAVEILAYYYPGARVTEIRALLAQPVTIIEGGS